MALAKEVIANAFGREISFPAAYIKVERVHGDKNYITAEVGTFSAKDGERISSEMVAFTHDATGENVIKQAYLHLKTLPEFAGATDV